MVIFVTPLEKPGSPPSTLDENFDTLLTIDAAKAEPGIFGMERDGGVPTD